jgi:predicted nucleic acid-binding OB-fold protein
MHSLELIPGIGKRLMFQILDIRERLPFKGFSDIEERANLKDPAGLIAKRVLEELSREEKYLGTIGSVKYIKNFHHDKILVMNSDLFTNIDFGEIFTHHTLL